MGDRHRITHLVLVPSIIHQLVFSPKVAKADLSSVQFAGSGAAYLTPELASRFNSMFKMQSNLAEGYGLSEVVSSFSLRVIWR